MLSRASSRFVNFSRPRRPWPELWSGISSYTIHGEPFADWRADELQQMLVADLSAVIAGRYQLPLTPIRSLWPSMAVRLSSVPPKMISPST
jgi:hypothetical protein